MSHADDIAPGVLITGASTGIGLAFARQYAARGWRVIPTHRGRTTPESLARLADAHLGVRPATMDITRPDEIAELADALRDVPLDILINNAGITHDGNADSSRQNLGGYDFGLMDTIFATNVKGPLRVSQAFAPHLERGQRKLLVTISSTHGSLTAPPPTLQELQGVFYCASKAALNREMQVVSNILGPRGVTVLVLHPGAVWTERYEEYVQTHGDAWPKHMFITLEESVSGLMKVIDNATASDNGRFFSHEGAALPW